AGPRVLVRGRRRGEVARARCELSIAVEVGAADEERLGDAVPGLAGEHDEQDERGGAVRDRGGDGGARDAPAGNQDPVEPDVDGERGPGGDDVDLLAVPAREVPREDQV